MEKGKSIKHQSIAGCTGFAIQKFIKFLFGSSPIKTEWENRTFVFYLNNNIFDNEQTLQFVKKFEKDFLVELKPIREYN